MDKIAGINATTYDTFDVDDMVGALDFDDETGAELVWGWESKIESFTPSQVREILIKFANSKNIMRRDMPVEHIVDEFIENGE